jgi:hypothetical protein
MYYNYLKTAVPGSGKTKVGCYEDLAWALSYPGSVGYIFEPSHPID